MTETSIESRAARIIGYIRRFTGRRTFAREREDFWSIARTVAAESIAEGRPESWACRMASRACKRDYRFARRAVPIETAGLTVRAIPPAVSRPIPSWYFVTCSPAQENAVRRRYEQDMTFRKIGEIAGTSYECQVIHHRRALVRIRSVLTA